MSKHGMQKCVVAFKNRLNLWDVAAFVTGLFIWWVYFQAVKPFIHWDDLRWPVFVQNGEALSLTTSGKWAFAPWWLHFRDAFSGDFPVYYQFFSDWLQNGLAVCTNLPPMVIQAIVLGPLLGFLFFVFNYYSLKAVLRNSGMAFLACFIISVFSDSQIPLQFVPETIRSQYWLLHVPFVALSLNTSQSFGWLFFTPAVCMAYLACTKRRIRYAVGMGVVFGLLFITHTLTFINAALALFLFQLLILLRKKTRLWDWQHWRYLAVAGITGGIVASTYLYHAIFVYGAVPKAYSAVAVSFSTIAVFFCPLLIGGIPGAYAIVNRKKTTGDFTLWIAALLIATIILSLNHLWGWNNHPYRFAIHLLFPLAILTAVGLCTLCSVKKSIMRIFTALLIAWFAWIGVQSVVAFLSNKRFFVNYQSLSTEHYRFLKALHQGTHEQDYLLTPPEQRYPLVSAVNALLLNYSRSRGFIPDSRYINWKERFKNRLAIFCQLFPGMALDGANPNAGHSFITCQQACTAFPIAAEQYYIDIKDLRLYNNILNAYRIRHFAFIGDSLHVLDPYLFGQLGWKNLLPGSPFLLADIPDNHIDYSASFSQIQYTDTGLSVNLTVQSSGEYIFLITGRLAGITVQSIMLNQTTSNILFRDERIMLFSASLAENNPSSLSMTFTPRKAGENQADWISFIAAVDLKMVDRFFAMQGQVTKINN